MPPRPRRPSASEIQQLGQALVDAIQIRKGGNEWPLRLEVMNLKTELVAFDPNNAEVFRIKTEGLWL